MNLEVDHYKSYICSGINENQTRWQLIISTIISSVIPWLICIFMIEDNRATFWFSIAVYTLPFIFATYIYSLTKSPKIYQLIEANILRAVSVYITYDISTVLLLNKTNADLSIILCSVIIPAIIFSSGVALMLIIIYSGRYRRIGNLGIRTASCFALGYIVAQYMNDDFDVDFNNLFGYKLLSAICFFIVVVMSIKIIDVLKLYFIRRMKFLGYDIDKLIIRDIEEENRKIK